MAKIYLIRHGQSLANIERKYQGQTYDTALSPLGQKQALAVANRLRDSSLTRVITSPLIRARQTAEIVASTLHLPLRVEPRLIETNHGDWEGQKFADLEANYPDLWHTWKTRPSQMVFPSGEAFAVTALRVLKWWKKAQSGPDNIAAVTHDNIIQIILTYVHEVSLDRMWEYPIKNASVTLIESPVVHHIGDVSHIIDIC